jgi:hypothetical protein
MPIGKPARHEEDHTRKVARLGNSQQEADDDKRRQAGDQGGGARKHAPGQDNGREPPPRTDPRQHHVGRHLEQHVAPEEGARSQAVFGRGEAKALVHGQRRDGHVGPVERVDEIANPDKRHETPGNLAHDGGLVHRSHGFLPIQSSWVGA